ncbi:phosphatase PAP2 family protein [Barrientosiimonas marina]|uniref:Phosphatase PAP2 family protein n=1 Tax=Lentibacillus kimchii TaxID=1542911 RepID=A0ABW2UY49_9BACI
MPVFQKRIFLGFCMVVAAVLFLVIGLSYKQPWLLAFDEQMQSYLYNFLGSSGEAIFVVITYMGSAYVSYPMLVILACVLLVQKRYWLTLLFVLNLLGVRLCNWLLKAVFERPRPEITHLVQVSSDSFPSGHAMNSIAFFGFLAFLLFRAMKSMSKPSGWVWMSAVGLIGLIGFSRVYLGVHYLSDVLGGLLAGGAWLFFSIFLYTYLPEHDRFIKPVRKAAHDSQY